MIEIALPRRRLLAATAMLALGACKPQNRCKTCGMVLDDSSRFRADLREGASVMRFDTPKCAFQALRSGGSTGILHAKGYYTQVERPEPELRFAAGSDVLGPMGIDLVPVEREHAKRFEQEHGAKRLYEAAEVTLAVLRDLS